MPPAPSIVEDENSNMASRRSLRQRPQKRYVEPSSDEDDESDSEPEAPTSDEREVLSAVRGSSSRSSKPKSRSSRDMDRAKKLELRKIRNRQSAAASRKRKSDRIDELEAQVAQLLEENERLKSQIGTPSAAATDGDAQSYHAGKRAKLTPPSASAAAMMARRRTASTLPSSYPSAGGVRSNDLCTNQLPAAETPHKSNGNDPTHGTRMRTASAESLRIPRPTPTAGGRPHTTQQSWSAAQAHYGGGKGQGYVQQGRGHAYANGGGGGGKGYHQAPPPAPTSSSEEYPTGTLTAEEYPTGTLTAGGVMREDSAGGTSDDGSEEGLSDADLEETCKLLLDPSTMGGEAVDGLMW